MDPVMIAIIAAVLGMMFWMSSRTKKQQAAASNFRDSLSIGQEVMTGSGLFGYIVLIEGDRITLASGAIDGPRSVWLRAAIAKLVEPQFGEEPEEDSLEGVEADGFDAGVVDADAAGLGDTNPTTKP